MFELLPWLIACVFLWVGAESEDTGDRVDPYWLTAVASIWFADYLMVAFRWCRRFAFGRMRPHEERCTALLALILNVLLVAAAGLAGAVGLLLAGGGWVVLSSACAAIAFPLTFVTLHWLRWLTDIPAMLASQARWHFPAAVFAYLSGLIVHALVLGWVAVAVWWIAPGTPGWAALAWGYAVVSGPLLLIVLRPFSYPQLLLPVFTAQMLYPLAWGALHYANFAAEQVVAAIGLIALAGPLIQFSRRWQALTAPD